MNASLKKPLFEKLLLSELRLVKYIPRSEAATGPATGLPMDPAMAPAAELPKDPATTPAAELPKNPPTDPAPTITADQLKMVMTVNEELRNLGYTLRPADLLRLAVSPSLETFAARFRSLIPDVAAPPMYPDFPTQVMEMPEAVFRIHQLMHYFSTYGMETLFGEQVLRGFLPDVPSTAKTESDDTLLAAKVLELIPEDAAALEATKRILGRRERMTRAGSALISLAVTDLEPSDLAGINVPFKENLVQLFEAILNSDAGDARILFWRQICQHTGDVMKCVRGILPHNHYHFRTGQKKALVRLLESYPPEDFRSNLALSRGKREQNLVVLQYLDYNRFSRSEAHREAVRALRNGELRSWESRAKKLLAEEHYPSQGSSAQGSAPQSTPAQGSAPQTTAPQSSPAQRDPSQSAALDFIAKRPGMMLRWLRWLLLLGYSEKEVRDRLVQSAGFVSPHTIVSILNALEAVENREPREDLFAASLQKKEATAKMRQEELKKQLDQSKPDPEEEGIKDTIQDLFVDLLLWDEIPGRRVRELSPSLKEAILRSTEREDRKRIDEYIRGYETARTLYERARAYNETVRSVLTEVLRAHFEQSRTELYSKKVCFQAPAFDLSYSRLKADGGASEGGYLPAGVAIRIPDEVRRVRFFVYWNDEERVDVDLHAIASDLDGNSLHVGWNADFRKGGIVHSGDITHSNAAEYIDIDLDAPIRYAETKIHLYYGKPSFGKIRECYVGMMAVKKLGQKVRLYDPKNCFFTHELRGDGQAVDYGYVDVPRRLLFFVGNDMAVFRQPDYFEPESKYRKNPPLFSVEEYLRILFEAQKVVLVEDPAEAEVILTLEKSTDQKAVSLVDRNYFLES